MSPVPSARMTSAEDAALAAALFAVDPPGLGGVALKALPGPVREAWLAGVRDLLPPGAPWRRIPLHITDGRLLGGLDLAATLRAGTPVVERGVLAAAHGGVIELAMAERLAPSTTARLVAVLDQAAVALERDGFGVRVPACFGVVAVDEGLSEDERLPAALLDRLAIHLDLWPLALHDLEACLFSADEIAAARTRLPAVHTSEAYQEALCSAAMALGVDSMRATLLALRVARVSAALHGRDEVQEHDAMLAARLVLAPRATVLPSAPDLPATEPPQPPAPSAELESPEFESPESTEAPEQPSPAAASEASHAAPDAEDRPQQTPGTDAGMLEEMVLAAALATMPAGLLARLKAGGGSGRRAGSEGRAGALRTQSQRGRPVGVRAGAAQRGGRLNLVETLRAAAPWQPLRRAESGRAHGGSVSRILVRREDFRMTRFKRHTGTTTIFVVDASGSSALHRMAEAKGAVELLLADCYVRRDRVALISFRGKAAQMLLPPTRSLVRARRSLAGLPGGGGTPLAAGIDAAAALCDEVRRRGETPVIVLMTDGRANIARDGAAEPARAEQDALRAARSLRAAALTSLFVDTSPRPRPLAQRFATEMGAHYLPLPYADAAGLSHVVRAAVATQQAALREQPVRAG